MGEDVARLEQRIDALERLVKAQGRCVEELTKTLDAMNRTMQMLAGQIAER